MKHDYFFGLQWIFVTLLAYGASLLWIEVGERPDVGLVEGAIAGALVGIAQAFVLRQRVSPLWGWIVASLVAWGLMAGSGFGAIGWVAPRTDAIALRFVGGLGFGAIGGGCLGVGQWFVLRRQIPTAWFWIIINAWCWAIALALGWCVGGVLRSLTHIFLSEVIGLGVTWLVVSAMTSIVLIQFFRS